MSQSASTMMQNAYAHSLHDQPRDTWERLGAHHNAVGIRAAEFAAIFGSEELARAAGSLHDSGKVSAEFLKYISQSATAASHMRGPDHSTAGARIADVRFAGPMGRMLAYVIAGHHAGLANSANLDRRLAVSYGIPDYSNWEAHAGDLPDGRKLAQTKPFPLNSEKGFMQAFLIRMLFSCLVDADFLETERFYSAAHPDSIARGGFSNVAALNQKLRAHMINMGGAKATPLNAIRTELLNSCLTKAALPPGLFTLTAPTGSGKTLASLSFALEHAATHGLRRVVYVIPFTSIIEQTASVFRRALDASDDILEHHASFDWQGAADARAADESEGADGLGKLKRSAENWDAPIVVTTAVQFFESLFANRTSRCRKLHNLAGAVIVLDEAQTMPLHLLRPCMAALDELARNYGASVVLCTATQPALRKIDGAIRNKARQPIGLDIDASREIAPDPARLYMALKRVEVERRIERVADSVIAARFGEQPQMLCIVNSRAHARELFSLIRDMPGAAHLTTLMCPRHRSAVLHGLRQRLRDGLPVRLVATSLIEAGVDISFPEVWRAAAGLDTIAQAAGRCNREGGSPLGRVVIFEAGDRKPPRSVELCWQAARQVLRHHSDPLGLAAIQAYFQELYSQKGDATALDAAKLDGVIWPILGSIAEGASRFNFEFESIARAFRLIEEAMEPVIIPWREHEDDRDCKKLLDRIWHMDRPLAGDLRRLQLYTVGIPRALRAEWLAKGVLLPVNKGLGDTILKLENPDLYDQTAGLNIFEPAYRNAEDNIIS